MVGDAAPYLSCCAGAGANASDMMVNRRFSRVTECALGLPELIGKLAVRQPEKVRAGFLAVSDLEYDAPRHVAGQPDGDAAARHGSRSA